MDVNDGGGYQHSGFDLFFTSGLTNNLPAMIPVTMLYGTPDDAAAQIAYIEKRGYPHRIHRNGRGAGRQACHAGRLRRALPAMGDGDSQSRSQTQTGGPIFEGVNEDITVWPDAQGRTSWMGRFVDYLKAHGRLADLALCRSSTIRSSPAPSHGRRSTRNRN